MTIPRAPRLLLLVFSTLLLLIPISADARADRHVFRTSFTDGSRYLTVELLDDDLAHFELSAERPDPHQAIPTSPMVARTDYPGAARVDLLANNRIETSDMRLQVDAVTLCVTVTDLMREPDLILTTLCPTAEDEVAGLTLTQEGTTDLYGLGEQFLVRRTADGNWMGKQRTPGNAYGNDLVAFNGGNVGNAQFPILYALGEGTDNYSLFLDSVTAQTWSFTDDPFTVETGESDGAPLRWYVMTGADLPDLRGDYMELTGTPPVPPKQMFGLWVSEYGYESWDELNSVLESLRAANFPVDGFLLDLYWFGGIAGADSQMGSLAWDEANFPDPAGFIAALRNEQGVGVMTIEESYVSASADGYDEALANGVLVKSCAKAACPPVTFDEWWGAGGMVDFTDPGAAAWWHDQRRAHLIDDGVIGHWTDLGEPEYFDPTAWYHGLADAYADGHDEASVHNLYNLLWSRSIWDGYQRHGVERRPFSLSRSGTSGGQRYGVAMWSGDIGANMKSLTAQMNVQMQMSLSGMDYFGSDIGGFIRSAVDPFMDADTLYTVWLANSALLDVPLRPHVANTDNIYHSAPSQIGDVATNLANVRLRYQLSPYLYSLAHRAYESGEPVFAPLVYDFQSDPAVRALGAQKMIGRDLMMTALTGYDLETVPVYLPAGGWFNVYTGEYVQSTGQIVNVPGRVDGLLRAPLFARDGAIIPEMRVDDQTMNVLGKRLDGTSASSDLLLSFYRAEQDGDFTLIEDDGMTTAYRDGAVQRTAISQQQRDAGWVIEVGAAQGDYAGAPQERSIELHLTTPPTADMAISRITLNGVDLSRLDSADAFASAESGWVQTAPGALQVKAAPTDVSQTQTFVLSGDAEAAAVPTTSPTALGTQVDMTEMDRPLLLAHFMPWYQTPDVSGYWGWHWTMDHFDPNQVDADGRPQIASQYMPLTGPYDSQDEAVLDYQVSLMKLSGIDGVIVDWYGMEDFRDYAVLNAATQKLFEAVKRAGLRFVVCYEDQTVKYMVDEGHIASGDALAHGQAVMQYMQDNWFDDPAYLRYDGQPVLFVFGPQYFRNPSDWETMSANLPVAPALVTLDKHMDWAAASSYPWPPMQMAGGIELSRPVLDSYLTLFYRNAQRRDWIVGSAFPGFHDIYAQAGVRSSYGYIDAQDGDTLRYTLDLALQQNPAIVQLVTWNDYGEGTMIEPTEEYGYRYLEIVQAARRSLDSSFTPTPDELQLPMRLLTLRRANAGDDAVNARLDDAFDALIAGDFQTAAALLTQ